MTPRVFVVQPVPDAALALLREVAEVTVYPHLDRQITTDELVANAKRTDYLFAMHETIVPAEVVRANPRLRGISVVARSAEFIDLAAARQLRIPVATLSPADEIYGRIAKATADLTAGMLLTTSGDPVPSQNRFTETPLCSCAAIRSRHSSLFRPIFLTALALVMQPLCGPPDGFGRGVHRTLTLRDLEAGFVLDCGHPVYGPDNVCFGKIQAGDGFPPK